MYSNRFEPEYPETLHRLHIGGSVGLAVTGSARGGVENVLLLRGESRSGCYISRWAIGICGRAHSGTTSKISIPFDAQR